MKPWNSIGKDGTGLRLCQVELRFSSCACVYSQGKMCSVHWYHWVYLADRNFLVYKYIFLACQEGKVWSCNQNRLCLDIHMGNSAIWLVNTKPQNKQMDCWIPPRRTCNPCGYAMKISCRYHWLLIYDVKRTTKIDGMGAFNKYLVKTNDRPIS